MKGSRRVVVTGMGAVSGLGNDVKSIWSGVLSGQSAARLISTFDVTEFTTKFTAAVHDFSPSNEIVDKRQQRRLDLFIQYALVAAHEAVSDAGLQDIGDAAKFRTGVAISSGIGGLATMSATALSLHNYSPKKVSPFFVPGSIVNMAAGVVSQQYGFKGPNYALATACAASCHSVGLAARTIAYGDADVMVTGGAEHESHPLGIAGFISAKALSRRNDAPEKASRPWDRDRDGFVLGDGAAILVLEEYEHAKARGATIYAEVKGFGMSGDAYHMTAADPSGSGFVRSIEAALADAELSPDAIHYVNAHGTSTPLADPIEHHAVKTVFGKRDDFAMSSTKSMTGHLLGAAGAIESIFSVLAIRNQVAPPTINLDNPEEGCDLNLVPHTAQERKIEAVLSNSFGFGGTNASLIFARV